VPLVNLTNLDLDNNQITDISALSNLSNLRFLYLYQNRITDIGPLENLASLSIVSLRDNRISDISALVRNVGIGAGDDVSIDRNPLSDIARNTQIPALEQRGVRVVY
jgi:internalin A